jgi:predicted dehydrogenase
MDNQSKIRVGIIGAGSAGKRHALTYRQLSDVRVTAIVDPARERVIAVAGEVGCAHFDEPDSQFWGVVDVVSVCVPHKLLAPTAFQAIDHQKPLLLEKPMALSLDDADAIIVSAGRAGVQLMVGFVHRFRAEVQQAHRALTAGNIGEPVFAVEQMILGGGTQPGWIWDREIAGGGVTFYNGVHGIDRLRWFLGSEVSTVAATSRRIRNDAEVEDLMLATMNFHNGTAASYNQNIALYPLSSGWRSEIYGTEGALLLGDGALVEVTQHATTTARVERSDRFLGEVTEFVQSVRDDREPSVTGADGREALAVALALEESAVSGEVITLSA